MPQAQRPWDTFNPRARGEDSSRFLLAINTLQDACKTPIDNTLYRVFFFAPNEIKNKLSCSVVM